ncbi:MAG: hypothetical protein PHS95_01300 [Candidatus Pacebacteria bacterium]|nr:hypothetical protein [Candidatus Paceibacterota bacterium]
MKFLTNKIMKRTISVLAVVAIFSVGAISLKTFAAGTPAGPATPSTPTTTTSPYNISGWTWSENIGWMSWNSTSDGSATSYGANVDTSNKATGGMGDMSGNVWSEHLGWISFDRTATGNPPSAPFNGGSGAIAKVDWSTGKVTGWMRALVGCEVTPGTPVSSCSGSGAGAAAGGWDGWIKLSDDSVGVWANKGVKVSANRFSRYAWASDVIGWIDFNPRLAGVDLGPVIFVPPCNPLDVPADGWGVCQAISQCVAPPATQTNVAGVQVGQCALGGTAIRSCTIATQTCTPATTGTTCGDGVCNRAGGETNLSCPKDCKSSVIQF